MSFIGLCTFLWYKLSAGLVRDRAGERGIALPSRMFLASCAVSRMKVTFTKDYKRNLRGLLKISFVNRIFHILKNWSLSFTNECLN